MNRIPVLSSCLALLLCAGCTLGPAAASGGVSALRERPREIFGDEERLEFAKRMQVTLPARLVVADRSRGYAGWSDDEDVAGRRVVALVDRLAQDRETWTDVGSLPWDRGDAGARDFEAWRRAASGHQADLLLLGSRRESVKTGHNALAILKILILPMLFLPTEEDELTLSVRTTVVDVRNGLVYATFEDQRRIDVTSTALGEDAAVERAFDAAWVATVDKMAQRLPAKLRSLERTAAGTE